VTSVSWLSKAAIVAMAPFVGAIQLRAESAGAAAAVGWSAEDWPPGIIVPVIACALLYGLGVLRMRRRSGRLPLRRVSSFAAGAILLLAALASPMHEISEQLFWVHMTQHEILMVISAPLLVLSHPIAPLLWGLPGAGRRAVAKMASWKLVRRGSSLVSAPLTAWLLHAVALWGWHVPRLFVAALESEFLHALQHICFLGTALLFWGVLFGKKAGRLGYGGAILYVFTTATHASVLGAWLTFSPQVWYAPYGQTSSIRHLTALEDQQLGGLIMWIPAGTLLTIVALVFLGKWLEHSQQRWAYTRTAHLIRTAGGSTE